MVVIAPAPLSFGPFRLDLRGRSLTRNGAHVGLGGRAFEVLAMLAAAGGQLVSKDVLLDQVWARAAVAENNLYAQISALRKALGEGVIVTVPGRGYRFATPTNDKEPPSADNADADRPTVAVLPFACLVGDAALEYFAHGLADELATALARFRSFFVCVPRLTIDLANGPADARLAAQRLGARYAIEGSVRAAAGRMRIVVRLVNVLSGLQLWAEGLDGTGKDIFELQDRVAGRVVSAIAPRLVSAEIKRVHNLPPSKGRPYGLLLRGLAQYCTRTRGGMEQAIRLLRRSIVLDPSYALAHAHLASIQWMMLAHFWARHDDPLVRDALRNAQTALALAADDPEVLLLVSTVLSTRGDDVDGAIAAADRSLALCPNQAATLRMQGVYRVFADEVGAAYASLAEADRLNSADTGVCSNWAHLVGQFATGEYDAAIATSGNLLLERPYFAPAMRYRAASLGLLGRVDEGRKVVKCIRDLDPTFSIARVRMHTEIDMNHAMKIPGVAAVLYEGLRRVSAPEG